MLIISAFSLTIFGQTVAKNEPKTSVSKKTSTQFFPLSELKEGMKGTARTVFRGSVAEEFNVEILGVVPGANRSETGFDYRSHFGRRRRPNGSFCRNERLARLYRREIGRRDFIQFSFFERADLRHHAD